MPKIRKCHGFRYLFRENKGILKNKEAVMEKFLQMTAWRMAVPRLYGCFHIFTAVLGIVFAAGAAIICAKVYTKIYRKSNAGGSSFSYRLYMIIGLVLLFSEGYKQLFNFYVMTGIFCPSSFAVCRCIFVS